jgi:hypothetical protein
LLRAVGTHSALLAPEPLSRRLCDLGMLRSDYPDGRMSHLTPAGLRALADAAEAGRISLFVESSSAVEERIRK